MITISQIRAARALLNWSQSDLAAKARLSHTGIARIENGVNKPNSRTLDKIVMAFDRMDIEFIGQTGVKKRHGEVQLLQGKEALSAFLDDVYETCRSFGSPEQPAPLYLSNIIYEDWVRKIGRDNWQQHVERMSKISDRIDVRVLVREGSFDNSANPTYAHYKTVPAATLKGESVYSYHDRLAYLKFHDDVCEILLIKQMNFAQSFRDLFSIVWDAEAQHVPDTKA